jgi:hypothetical protein
MKPRLQDILPAPTVWIDIPEGVATLTPKYQDMKYGYLKEPTTLHVPSFSVSKYPISNAQYYQFMKAGGYENRQWWTDAGWEDKLGHWTKIDGQLEWIYQPRTEPRRWTVDKCHRLDYADSLKWYEMIAFCNWLSDVMGEHITLLTDQQWQRLEDDWYYPYGVMDMDYYLYYYCLTDFETGSDDIQGDKPRVLRGASFSHDKPVQSFRNHYYPWDYSSGFGFYIAKKRV